MMQTSIGRHGCNAAQTVGTGKRSVVLRHAPFTAKPASTQRNVEVSAKRKGKTFLRQQGGVPGAAEMIKREPPTPDVDPDNVEFVIFIRARNFMDGKVEINQSQWTPLSIVKAGNAANYLVKAMESEWGRKLYAKTLIRNIGLAVYKDRTEIERGIRANIPPFKSVPSSNFEFGFKVRDKANPKDWWKATSDITVLPAEKELQRTALDALKDFFAMDNIMTMFGGSSPAAAPSQTK